ncbi:MAG: TOBE domain-containing protein [Actinobacteria bacterium]|nr:TOBE domain-containing protein [Actinomycetota bacterium]
MQISGRNKLKGTVKSVEVDGLMAKVAVDVSGQQLTAVITRDAVEELAIRQGDQVDALIKATSVMIMK